MQTSGALTQKAVVDTALRLLVQNHAQTSIRKLRGKVQTVQWVATSTNPAATARTNSRTWSSSPTSFSASSCRASAPTPKPDASAASSPTSPSSKPAAKHSPFASTVNYRKLRSQGIPIRKISRRVLSHDGLIATTCILGNHTLLHRDRDFDPFEQHLGLQVLHP